LPEIEAPVAVSAFHLLKKTINPLLTGILFFPGAGFLTSASALFKFHFIIVILFRITNLQAVLLVTSSHRPGDLRQQVIQHSK